MHCSSALPLLRAVSIGLAGYSLTIFFKSEANNIASCWL
jgi:hypothetical protein